MLTFFIVPHKSRKRYNDNVINRLLEEGRKLTQLTHPHIVQCKDSFLNGGRPYLVMEYIAGTNLASLSSKNLPEAEALNYIRQIGKALTEVHEQGFLHLDVKPANIILKTGKPEVVLVDFDLARNIDRSITTRNDSKSDGFSAL